MEFSKRGVCKSIAVFDAVAVAGVFIIYGVLYYPNMATDEITLTACLGGVGLLHIWLFSFLLYSGASNSNRWACNVWRNINLVLFALMAIKFAADVWSRDFCGIQGMNAVLRAWFVRDVGAFVDELKAAAASAEPECNGNQDVPVVTNG